ncbi:MAG TPA: hypothetical protein VML54_14110, partial [Candidatus Limnocylindrales bacterium]|nr:hypothetical protein [Candidatus Limnocylindrales bacterium]
SNRDRTANRTARSLERGMGMSSLGKNGLVPAITQARLTRVLGGGALGFAAVGAFTLTRD